jgi:hypothetical protein
MQRTGLVANANFDLESVSVRISNQYNRMIYKGLMTSIHKAIVLSMGL